LTVLVAVAALTGAVAGPAPGAESPPRYAFEKSRIKTIYVVPSAHWDRGWFLPVDDETKLYKQHLDAVIGLCQQHAEFRWMVETSWTVEQWLKQTPDARERERLFALVRHGRIGLPGNYMVEAGAFRAEEANRLAYAARDLRDTWRVPINTALMDDQNGYSWALPQVLARSGIRYFLAGPNFSFGGSFGVPKKDQPFYWQGPDGSKVLAWVSEGYGEAGDRYGLTPNLSRFFSPPDSELRRMTDMQITESRMGKALRELDQAGYPYDAVLTINSGDYADPQDTLKMLAYFARWKQAHPWPELRLALPEEFFRHIQEKHAGHIQTHAGDWSIFGDSAAPALTAMSRWTGDHLPVLEKLASINRLVDKDPSLVMGGTKYIRHYPAEEINSAYRRILEADGHGGGPGTGWAGLSSRRELEHGNEVHFSRMRAAHEEVSYLLAQEFEGLARQIQSDGPAVVVVNPLSWERTDVVQVHIGRDLLEKGFRLEDAANSRVIPWQKLGETDIEFLAENVPSLGYHRYRLVPAAAPPAPAPAVTVAGSVIEGRFYKVAVDEHGDIVSILDKEQARELVNARSKFQFNRLTRAEFADVYAGKNVYHPLPSSAVTVAGEPGALSGKLVVTREGSPHVTTEIVLYDKLKRMDLIHVLDRAKFGQVSGAKEADHYFLPFPFDLSLADLEVRVESTSTFLSPPASYLPGVVIGPFCSQHGVDLRDQTFGLVLANRQAAAVDFGDLGGFKTRFAPAEPTLISRLLMKCNQAGTRDHGWVTLPEIEPGADRYLRYEYSLTSGHSGFDPVAAVHFGWDFNIPLLATFIEKQTGPLAEPSESFFALDTPNVMVVDVKRADFGNHSDYILRLQEIAGLPETRVTVHSAFPIKRAELDTLTEERLRDLPTGPLVVPAGEHETLTLRLGL
jgi:hypothetical protein